MFTLLGASIGPGESRGSPDRTKSSQFAGDLPGEDFVDGEGHNEGVVGVVEGDEEAFVTLGAAHGGGLSIGDPLTHYSIVAGREWAHSGVDQDSREAVGLRRVTGMARFGYDI